MFCFSARSETLRTLSPTQTPGKFLTGFLVRLLSTYHLRQWQDSYKTSRASICPPNPRNIEQIAFALETSDYSHLYKGCATYNGHFAFIFFPDELVTLVGQVQELAADATFKCCPLVLGTNKQHFTAMGRFKQNFIPLIFVSMASKLEGLYAAVLDLVKQQLPSLQPATAHSDYEHGLQNALENVLGWRYWGVGFTCAKVFGGKFRT